MTDKNAFLEMQFNPNFSQYFSGIWKKKFSDPSSRI